MNRRNIMGINPLQKSNGYFTGLHSYIKLQIIRNEKRN
jgi:hypothetical protein